MKLSAVVSRAVEKDYVDIYFLLQNISLQTMLDQTKQKMPDLDENLILKSLVYFDDVEREKIVFKHDKQVSFETVQLFLKETVQKLKSDGL